MVGAPATETGLIFGAALAVSVDRGVPVVLAILYFGFIASGQFVSEARFVVRTSSHNDVGNLASLMQNQKISRASDETFAVADYLKSRDI